MTTGMVTVASFNQKDEAEHLKERLQAAGIHAEGYDASKLQKFWFWSKPLAGKKIRVDQHDFERAKILLADLDAREHVLDHAVRCPECGSSRVEYPQFTRKFITTTLVEIFCTTRILEKQFYCQDCQFTWSPEIKPELERDILGWPKKETAEAGQG